MDRNSFPLVGISMNEKGSSLDNLLIAKRSLDKLGSVFLRCTLWRRKAAKGDESAKRYPELAEITPSCRHHRLVIFSLLQQTRCFPASFYYLEALD